MGGWVLSTFLIQMISSLNLLAVANVDRPEVGDAPIAYVRVPSIYTEKDNAQLVIEGEFPSTCYTPGKVSIRAKAEDIEQGVIQLHLESLRFKRPNCTNTKTPFSKIVDLGILPRGSYKILEFKSLRKMAALEIHATTESAQKN